MDNQKEKPRSRFLTNIGGIVFGERFIGREFELSQIRDRVIEDHGNLSIVGMPRIGKTSLAWQAIMTHRDENFRGDNHIIPVFIESGSVESSNDYLYLMIKELIKSIKKCRANSPDILDDSFFREIVEACDDFFNSKRAIDIANSFKDVFQLLYGEGGFSVIYILDEFDHVQDIFDMAHFQLLREVSINPESRVSIVTTSRRSIEEIESKDGAISNFHGTFIQLYVGTFTDSDVDYYFNRFAEEKIIKNDVRKQIVSIVGNHPFLLDLCCDFFFRENINSASIASFKMKMYAEYQQLVNILERDNLFDAAVQLVIGPPFNVQSVQLDKLTNFGVLKKVKMLNKCIVLNRICSTEDQDELSFVMFSDFFTQLFYNSNFSETPYWPLWGKTENKLRWLLKRFVVDTFGDNWEQKIEADNRMNRDWMNYWNEMKRLFESNKALPIDNHPSSIIDFTETGHIVYQFIERYWDIWFSKVFKLTPEELAYSQRTGRSLNAKKIWWDRFQKLILIRRPFAHNNSGILSAEEIDSGKQCCELVLRTIDEWESTHSSS